MAETAATTAPPVNEEPPITIKKYANRRLYNTATSSYVTLDHLAQMVKDGTDFVVYDAKTGEDITRQVLTQIIVEEESKGQNLLPISFLRHLISFYGDSLQAIVPRYLDYSMQSFARNQEQMRTYMRDALNGLMPFGRFEEMGKQNMALFESAMKMFSPFYKGDAGKPGDAGAGSADKDTGSSANEELDDLRAKINQMQKQLDELTSGRKRP
jgi:polyhydroxyalkanoate synthesis repressor PhaR